MRSTNDPIEGLKSRLLDWGVVTEEELKTIDKEARAFVDAEVDEAEESPVPEPTPKVLFESIYVSSFIMTFHKSTDRTDLILGPWLRASMDEGPNP